MEREQEEKMVSLPYFGMNKLWPFLKPYGFTIFSMVFLGFLGGLADIIMPLFQEYAIDHFIAKQTLSSIERFTAAYVAVLLFQVVANGISVFMKTE